jgi:uncharacterized phage-associated protein
MPWETQRSARDVAAAILTLHPGLDQMQLHKLLYLTQAASLAWFDEPAFEDRIEAWMYGPMVRGVAGTYMEFGDQPIEGPVNGDPEALSKRARWVVERVLDEFGDLGGPALAKVTKREGTPWRTTRGDLPEGARSDREIPQETIGEFHRLHGVLRSTPSAAETRLAARFFDGDNAALAELFEAATGARTTVE